MVRIKKFMIWCKGRKSGEENSPDQVKKVLKRTVSVIKEGKSHK